MIKMTVWYMIVKNAANTSMNKDVVPRPMPKEKAKAIMLRHREDITRPFKGLGRALRGVSILELRVGNLRIDTLTFDAITRKPL